MKFNINTLLLVLAAVAGMGPDLTAVSTWLAASGIPHAVGIAHVIALMAAALAGLALAIPKLRGILAALKLATHPEDILPSTTAPVQQKRDAGHSSPVNMFLLLLAALAAFVVIAVAPRKARAEGVSPCPSQLGCLDAANTYSLVPTTAVGWQVNLKDGSVANVVSLIGLAVQHTYGSVPMGIGIYGGLGASTSNSHSYQACAGLSITNWGMLCLGPQRATFNDGSSAWQVMVTFAGTLTYGGSPAHVQQRAAEAKAGF